MFNRSFVHFSFNLQAIIALILFSSSVLASNDLDKWKGEVGKSVRESHLTELEKTTYREISAKDVKVSSDMRTVYPQIETKATVAGSKTRVVADAVLEVDKEKVARDWNRKLSKVGKGVGVVTTVVAIADVIIKGLDWVMDEGGKITKKPTEEEINFLKYTYYENKKGYLDFSAKKFSSPQEVCDYQYQVNHALDPNVSPYSCKLSPKEDSVWQYDSDGRYIGICAYTYPKDNFDPNSVKNIVISDSDVNKAIKDILNDPSKKDLAKDIIANSYTIDKPSSDNAEIAKDIVDKDKEILKSNDPKKEGKTTKDPKIKTGTEVEVETKTETKTDTDVNEETKPNPDGSTTTTGTNTTNTTNITNNNISLPAFCEYAAIVCEWIEWTQEEPEKDDEEDEDDINDQGIFDREFEIDFLLPSSCPPDYTFQFKTKYIADSYTFSMSWLCMFFSGISYPLVFLSHCIGAWIFYEIAVRRGNQGG